MTQNLKNKISNAFKELLDNLTEEELQELGIKLYQDYIAPELLESYKEKAIKEYLNEPEVLSAKISETLQQFNIPASLNGYHYIREAMILIIKEPKLLNAITYGLYPALAKKFDTTPSRVERAIRKALETAWSYPVNEYRDKIFAHCIRLNKKIPTNYRFLATLYEAISLGKI